MIIRSNKIFEEAITMGIELSLKNEYIMATYLMKKAGVPHHTVLRVLYDQDKKSEIRIGVRLSNLDNTDIDIT